MVSSAALVAAVIAEFFVSLDGHSMTEQFRQSLFGRVGGYEDVNDAERLGRDPAMRWIVGGKAVERQAASTS